MYVNVCCWYHRQKGWIQNSCFHLKFANWYLSWILLSNIQHQSKCMQYQNTIKLLICAVSQQKQVASWILLSLCVGTVFFADTWFLSIHAAIEVLHTNTSRKSILTLIHLCLRRHEQTIYLCSAHVKMSHDMISVCINSMDSLADKIRYVLQQVVYVLITQNMRLIHTQIAFTKESE